MKKSISYNPRLNVAENAKRSNVSITMLRGYIQRNGIDQEGNRQRLLYDKIHKLMLANPGISIYRLARLAKVDYKTAKRYAAMTEQPNVHEGKQSVLRQGSILVKSVYDREEDVLDGIAKLYLPAPSFDADMTYSQGGFYRHFPPPRLKFDIAPQFDDVRPLHEFDELADGSLGSVVIDLPFFAGSNPGKLYYAGRYGQFNTAEELLRTHADMMSRAAQKLAPKGILVVKTQPFLYSERQVWTNHHVYNIAGELNLEMVDEFVLINPKRMLHVVGQQKHARRFHVYFLCFRKRIYKKGCGRPIMP